MLVISAELFIYILVETFLNLHTTMKETPLFENLKSEFVTFILGSMLLVVKRTHLSTS